MDLRLFYFDVANTSFHCYWIVVEPKCFKSDFKSKLLSNQKIYFFSEYNSSQCPHPSYTLTEHQETKGQMGT